MRVVRRTPHSELGNLYERQQLECPAGHKMGRNVDANGVAGPAA
jgi:hypothetical protein